MNREAAVARLEHSADNWDVLVIGGGATGLGVAVDASLRGYRTLLLEAHDFAQGTSSRSTKLIHGGVRYLKQGNVSLVREALRERGRLVRNVPDLVHPLPFVVPVYSLWEKAYYGVGLKFYDVLSGTLSLGSTRWLTREETLGEVPNLNPAGLVGGVRYVDGQFDDAGLAVRLAQTIFQNGGWALNYAPVRSFLKHDGRIVGVVAEDLETGRTHEIRARGVVNATGIFSDLVRRLDEAQAAPALSFSQGAHLVFDSAFLPGGTALMIPKTKDGRVLFAIPWQGHTLLGTTDTRVEQPDVEPVPKPEEISFLLDHAAELFERKPRRADIRSCFAGVRPLLNAAPTASTARLSREHGLSVSSAGLVTITGGKWTSYRQMAEDTVHAVAQAARLGTRECRTQNLALPPFILASESPADAAVLHPRLPYRKVDLRRAVEAEMARTVEDVLARRFRALFLDVEASLELADGVAEVLARQLGRTDLWKQNQVASFRKLARSFLPP